MAYSYLNSMYVPPFLFLIVRKECESVGVDSAFLQKHVAEDDPVVHDGFLDLALSPVPERLIGHSLLCKFSPDLPLVVFGEGGPYRREWSCISPYFFAFLHIRLVISNV